MKIRIHSKFSAASAVALCLLTSTNISAQESLSVEQLPIHAVVAAEKNGVMKIASANGRFEFRGILVDRWSNKQILTMADARHSMNHIELAGINMKDGSALDPYKFGTGEQQVMVFVDPYCPACSDLLAEMPAESTEYTFNVVPVGLLGEKSRNTVFNLSCAIDQDAARAQIKNKQFSDLKMDPNCKLDLTTRRMLSAQLLGVTSLPFVIRDDGLVSRGMPSEGLVKWLEK